MEYQLKSKEYYEENKKNFNKFFNNITKLFINRTKIGCCSCLCHKFHPVDYQDFFSILNRVKNLILITKH